MQRIKNKSNPYGLLIFFTNIQSQLIVGTYQTTSLLKPQISKNLIINKIKKITRFISNISKQYTLIKSTYNIILHVLTNIKENASRAGVNTEPKKSIQERLWGKLLCGKKSK